MESLLVGEVKLKKRNCDMVRVDRYLHMRSVRLQSFHVLSQLCKYKEDISLQKQFRICIPHLPAR